MRYHPLKGIHRALIPSTVSCGAHNGWGLRVYPGVSDFLLVIVGHVAAKCQV